MALFPERTGLYSPHRPTARPGGPELFEAYLPLVRFAHAQDMVLAAADQGQRAAGYLRRPGQTAFSLACGVRRSVLGDRWRAATPGRCDGR
jgi:hypothetical protein